MTDQHPPPAPRWWHCETHGPGNATAWGCPECVREMRAEIRQLRLAEEGAKTAFGHVVDSKRALEQEIAKLRINLQAAHDIIRRNAKRLDDLRMALRGLLDAVDAADQAHPLDRPEVGSSNEAKAARAALQERQGLLTDKPVVGPTR